MTFIEWAIKHRVSLQALEELRVIMGVAQTLPNPDDNRTEAYTQSVVRLEASRKGYKLWRNNVGVLIDATGRPVRYGLANDSKKLNETIKSADLIGWRSVLITPTMAGQIIAQFVSRECKRPDWVYGGDAHEKAQLRWAQTVSVDGGDAKFCTGEGTL